MGRGAGAAEEFITVGEAASKAIVNSGKKRVALFTLAPDDFSLLVRVTRVIGWIAP